MLREEINFFLFVTPIVLGFYTRSCMKHNVFVTIKIFVRWWINLNVLEISSPLRYSSTTGTTSNILVTFNAIVWNDVQIKNKARTRPLLFYYWHGTIHFLFRCDLFLRWQPFHVCECLLYNIATVINSWVGTIILTFRLSKRLSMSPSL